MTDLTFYDFTFRLHSDIIYIKPIFKMAENDKNSMTINFQFGMFRDKVSFDSDNYSLMSVKRIICSLIEEKFPSPSVPRLFDRLLIFRHDYSSSNILQVSLILKYYYFFIPAPFKS